MHSLPSEAASVDANDIELPFECPTNEELENRVVSPCGRFESFDFATEDKARVAYDTSHRLIYLVFDCQVLSVKVYERNSH